VSRAATGKVLFGPWLPDLPATDNPGVTQAKNVLPVDKFYRAYMPMNGSGDVLAARPRGGLSALDTAGNAFLYVGTTDKLWVRDGDGWDDRSGAVYTTATNDYWRFAQFEDYVIATNYADVPQALEAGDAGNFAGLALVGTAPSARQIGIVGQHVVLGDTNDGVHGVVPYKIQWNRIGDPTEWPVPGSADALSKQAGEQFMPSARGAVRGIFGNDQFGIILQKTGITRMTYVGGDLVYQFDEYESTRGAEYPNACVQVGDSVYFIAADGFYATNGVSVVPIGAGKFDRFFLDSVNTGYKDRVYGGLDRSRNLIYWIYPAEASVGGRPNRVIAYNYREDRPAWAEDEIECLIAGLTSGTTLDALDDLFPSIDDVTPSLDDPIWQGGNQLLLGFNSTYQLASFTGTPGVATLETPEVELNPGLYTDITGFRPVVQGNSSITVALGTRNTEADSVSYTSEVSPTSRTGVADFRACARLNRARVMITGDFPAAQGGFFQSQAGGAT
jgi:hypothetical protein